MKPAVYLMADHLPGPCLEALQARFDVIHADPRALETVLPEGPVALVVTVGVRVDATLIARLPKSLRVIATYSVGMDHIDRSAAGCRGVAVVNTPGTLAASVAETTMFLMIGAIRRARENLALLGSGQWQGWRPDQVLGHSLVGRRLGILGLGEIGLEVAARARSFGMAVCYHNRKPRAEIPADWTYVGDLETFLCGAEVLVLAAPLTSETRHFLNAETIGLLPKGAVVVNIARGEMIEDGALIEALRSGHVYAAGLDVFRNEPNVPTEYLELPNVFSTPHMGSSTSEARMAMMDAIITGIQKTLQPNQSLS